MQCNAGAQQRVVAAVQIDDVLWSQRQSPGPGPHQRLDIAKASVTVLQVRFQPIRDIARPVLTLPYAGAQLGEVLVTTVRPRSLSSSHHFVSE